MKKKKKPAKKTIGGTMAAIKAIRKANREDEIRQHGKPVSYQKVAASKKVYNRKKNKADAGEALPYLLLPLTPKGE